MTMTRSDRFRSGFLHGATATLVLFSAASASAQVADTTRPRTRAESLYVSSKWEDHPPRDFARDIAEKQRIDSIYRARSKGVMDFQKITYRSSVGDMDIPAYLFQPLVKRGPRGHAARSGCTGVCTATGAPACFHS
jgi:hypothetical protein